MNLFLFQQINPVKFFDERIFNGVNQLAGKWLWLDTFGIYFAQYLEYVLIFCLLLFLFLNFEKYWKMVLGAFVSAILARLVIVNFIRWILPRARPFVENQVNLLLEHVPSSAFPSGHAAFYFAIVTIIFLYLKKMEKRPRFWWQINLLFFGCAFIIVISRVFCGIHWPLDILAGAIVGIFSGWLIHRIWYMFNSRC